MGGRLCSEAVGLMAVGAIKGPSRGARLVLLTMCSVARDRDQKNVQKGIYFGGWELLSGVLGFPEHSPAAKVAVARCVRELTDAGLLEPLVEKPRTGLRQVYRVTLPHLGSL